jgi:hypothetical protein
MSIRIKRINNEIVRPIKFQYGGDDDERPIKGVDLFPDVYCNIFICAKKKSGKTTTLKHIIESCATMESTVMIFCSTKDKDNNHLAIKHLCKSKHIAYVAYTSMNEDGINVLGVLLDKLREEAEERNKSDSESDSEEQPTKRGLVLFESEDDEVDEEPKKRKCKYKAPEYIIVLDDISNELKNKLLVKVLKESRHYRFKCICISQYMNDLLPESIKQLDYCLLFRGEPEVKLMKIWKDLDITIPFDDFKRLYYYATKKKYSFLYIDVRNELFRQNFDLLITPKSIN